MDLKQRLFTVLDTGKSDIIPVVSVTQTATVYQMQMTDSFWPKSHRNPKLMASLALAGHTIAGFEAVRYPYCLTVLAEAMGCDVNMGRIDVQPSVIAHPLSDEKNEVIYPDDLLNTKRVPSVLEATRILKERTDGTVPLIAGMEGPATLTAHLAGMYNFLTWSVLNPENIDNIMQIAAEVCIEYANALLDCGADIISVADGIAGPDLLDPAMYGSLVQPLHKKLADRIKGRKIIHMCGSALPILDAISECGFDVISLEESIDLSQAREIISGRTLIAGNVSAYRTLLSADPENVIKESRQCLEKGVDILAPSCGIAPRSPIKNLKAMVRARNEYCIN